MSEDKDFEQRCLNKPLIITKSHRLFVGFLFYGGRVSWGVDKQCEVTMRVAKYNMKKGFQNFGSVTCSMSLHFGGVFISF